MGVRHPGCASTTWLLTPDATIDTVGEFFDGLDCHQRWAQVQRLGRDQQRVLYSKAKSSAIDLSHFIKAAGPLAEVVHDGFNTLPVALKVRRFQKRFCRPTDGDSVQLLGYNEGPLRRLIGPGYFVAVPTGGEATWQSRGSVVVDYFQVPQGEVAEGWPRVVPNDRGLQRYVYHQTRDFMRRVSDHVSIGAVFKRERAMDHYFVLCRRD